MLTLTLSEWTHLTGPLWSLVNYRTDHFTTTFNSVDKYARAFAVSRTESHREKKERPQPPLTSGGFPMLFIERTRKLGENGTKVYKRGKLTLAMGDKKREPTTGWSDPRVGLRKSPRRP